MTLRKLKKIIEAKHAYAYNDAWRHVEALRNFTEDEKYSEEAQEHRRLYFMCRAQVNAYEDLLTLIEGGK